MCATTIVDGSMILVVIEYRAWRALGIDDGPLQRASADLPKTIVATLTCNMMSAVALVNELAVRGEIHCCMFQTSCCELLQLAIMATQNNTLPKI